MRVIGRRPAPAVGEGLGDEAGGELSGAEGRMIDDVAQEGLAGLDAEDRQFAQRGRETALRGDLSGPGP